MKKRKLKDGTEVNELDQAVQLTVTTKCPNKWLLIDRETGEAYEAYTSPGKHQWKKLYNAEWNIDA